MSFVYPRRVTITRPKAQGTYGAAGYRGQALTIGQGSGEDVIATGIAASIQLHGRGGTNPAKLPGDARQTNWKVFIPLGAVAPGLIQARDIVTDDLNARYQVADPYYTSLGYQLACERLET